LRIENVRSLAMEWFRFYDGIDCAGLISAHAGAGKAARAAGSTPPLSPGAVNAND
jgi:hypothetical protein